MARKVYKLHKQYSSVSIVNVLKQFIRENPDEINSDHNFKLYRRMPRRLMSFMDRKGKAAMY